MGAVFCQTGGLTMLFKGEKDAMARRAVNTIESMNAHLRTLISFLKCFIVCLWAEMSDWV